MKTKLLTALVPLALAAACATNPATGRREVSLMSESQEIAIGQEQDALVRREMGIYENNELQQYVSRVGMSLAALSERPTLPWHFAVVDQPAINAFALPGGYIYITRGILPFLDNEAELAGVLGHEIGHVTARHAAQQYTRSVGGQVGLVALGIFVPGARPFGDLAAQGLGVLFLKYGRDDELQADSLGVRYAARGNWDPAGVPGMLSTLGRLDEAEGSRKGVPNFLSTHPEPLTRVTEIQPQVQQARAGRTDWKADPEPLQRRIDGIIYGDNPDQGIVRGTTFLHPKLRFKIDFPAAWDIQNSADQVVAKAPDADVYMLLQTVEKPQGRDIQEIAQNSMRDAGFRAVQGEATRVAGVNAFVGVYQGQLQDLGAVTMRAAHIPYNNVVYLVAGLTAPERFQQADGAFTASIRSFTALSAAEAENIHPNRIDFYVVRQGDSWASIAQRSGGVIKASTLAIMNDAEPSSTPRVGSRIEIVVGG
jgi:predicted Zn-dependent protease